MTPYSLRPARRAACLVGDEPVRVLCAGTHAPLDHASLPFDCFLPSRHGTHTSHARTFLLVDSHERLHPLVAARLPKVPSAEYIAIDDSLARHLDSPRSGTGHCCQRELFWAAADHARGNTYVFLAPNVLAAARIFSLTGAEFTAERSANALINRCIPLGNARVVSSRTTSSISPPSFCTSSTSF